ncbi:MAG: cobalamin biosynthesis protein [Ruminococcus sp.]|nr:cobalamin biosynthesis protein [Ruminococcus sp.]
MIITTLAAMAAGYLLSVMVGTPSAISARRLLSKLCGNLAPKFSRSYLDSEDGQHTGGGFFIALVMLIVTLPTALILVLLYWKLPIAALVVDALICWSCLDIRESSRLSQAAARCVRSGNLTKASKVATALGKVDCSELGSEDIIRASVQGTADSTVDSASLLFYMALLSGFGGILYRAVDAAASANVGEAFLTPSKKVREFLCFLPGKIAAGIMLVDALFLRMNVHSAERVLFTDRKKCARRSVGGCRAVLAGLLGISLLPEVVLTESHNRRTLRIGEQVTPPDSQDISIANQLMLGTAFIMMALFFMIKLTVGIYFR